MNKLYSSDETTPTSKMEIKSTKPPPVELLETTTKAPISPTTVQKPGQLVSDSFN